MSETTIPAPPFSDLASPASAAHSQAKADIWVRIREAMSANPSDDVAAMRGALDDIYFRPHLARMREVFDVTIDETVISGVRTDVVRPAGGVPPGNADSVLIEVHGGGFTVGGGLSGQQESVSISALGGVEVVAVDYRMAPEHGLRDAIDDIAAVYRALLARYDPARIGIYGCSAGGYLSAVTPPWLESLGLPPIGAIGVYGMGASMHGGWGDWGPANSYLHGTYPETAPAAGPFFDGFDADDPRLSPVLHPDVLARYPSTLLVSGTRDLALSRVVDLHARLVAARVDARLHIWEGAEHCSFAQGIVDPLSPETRQAWDVMIRFFAERLGFTPPSPEEDS